MGNKYEAAAKLHKQSLNYGVITIETDQLIY